MHLTGSSESFGVMGFPMNIFNMCDQDIISWCDLFTTKSKSTRKFGRCNQIFFPSDEEKSKIDQKVDRHLEMLSL